MSRSAALAGRAGLFVPIYALWEPSSPLPSFAHLATLAAKLPHLGIDVVSTLPLYAAYLDEPFDPSPYAPVSRLHWNEVYLGDPSLPAAPTPTWLPHRLAGARPPAPAAAPRRGRDLDPYIQAGARPLRRHASGRRRLRRVPGPGAEPADAGHSAALIERSHLLAQYLADRQLSAVEGPGRAALALDLPIGSHPDGYETWAFGELFAEGMTVGAPPDEFFDEGQDWGFPPQLPGAGRRSGHALWQRLVARAGEHASLLRIDHVMGVQRLWWIPAGAGARTACTCATHARSCWP